MELYEMRQAIAAAEKTLRDANTTLKEIGVLLEGRVRSGNLYVSTLCKLKKELANFNMHTGQWKE